eukprot:4989875-Pleurochrysis_carterae.AAC.1
MPASPLGADAPRCARAPLAGDYLATGDRGGRIVVFERGAEDPQQVRTQPSSPAYPACIWVPTQGVFNTCRYQRRSVPA